VIFSLRISSNKFKEDPTFEHLYFSGGLPCDPGSLEEVAHADPKLEGRAESFYGRI